MESLLRYSPSSLNFEIVPDQQTTVHLSITNITSDPVAYKVKTTHIKRYSVRPNAAILSPGESLDVEVVQQAFRGVPEDLDNCRDRFLLQAVRLSEIPDLAPKSPVTTVWELATQDIILKTKFSVTIRLAPPALAPDVVPAQSDSPTSDEPQLNEKPFTEGTPPNELPPKDASLPPVKPIPLGRPPSPPNAKPIPKSIDLPAPTPTSPKPSKPSSSTGTPTTKSPPVSMPSSIPAPPVTPTSIAAVAEGQSETNYKSAAYVRSRALGVRPAPKVSTPQLDRTARQRVAVERAGELCRAINERQEEIDKTKRDLAEARHKLSDARMATSPAYDVRHEVDEDAKVPLVQTCIIALLSGALLSLMIGK